MIVERGLGEEARIARCEFVLFFSNTFYIYFFKFNQLKNCHRCRDYERLQADFSAKQQELIDLRSAHGRLQKVKKKSSDDEIYNTDENVAGVIREGGGAKSCCQEGGEL